MFWLRNIALAGWSRWLAHPPVHQKVVGSIPTQGSYLDFKFGPYLGHVGEATYQCLSPSLKSINILLKKKKYEGKTKTTGPLKAEVQSALESRSAGLAS